MHHTQNKQHQTHLGAQALDRLCQVGGLIAVFERERDIADVHEVKPGGKHVVDRIRQSFVSQERVDQEDSTVLHERSRDPDCQRYADCQVGDVGSDDIGVHDPCPLLLSASPGGVTERAWLPWSRPIRDEIASSPSHEQEPQDFRSVNREFS
jgi:hypothetical protein